MHYAELTYFPPPSAGEAYFFSLQKKTYFVHVYDITLSAAGY